MEKQIFLFALCALIVHRAYGCRCRQPPPFEVAVSNAKPGPSPYYIATVLSDNDPIDINRKVTYVVQVKTGCSSTRTQVLTTCGNTACCGVPLTVGQSYALPLARSGVDSQINSCQRFASVKSLTEAQKDLVSWCQVNPPIGFYQCTWRCTYHPGRRCSNYCRHCCKNGVCHKTDQCSGPCKTRCTGNSPPALQPICSYECRRNSVLRIANCWQRCKCCCLNGKCKRYPCERRCLFNPKCGFHG